MRSALTSEAKAAGEQLDRLFRLSHKYFAAVGHDISAPHARELEAAGCATIIQRGSTPSGNPQFAIMRETWRWDAVTRLGNLVE